MRSGAGWPCWCVQSVTELRSGFSRSSPAAHNGEVLVPSSDHVNVVVHEFGGAGRPLLLSHATGFHGYCYLPIADELSSRFTSYALDYRGFGDTARPDDWHVDWTHYGDDAEVVAKTLAPDGGLIGFGHSMGGAGLLMAARRNPGLFDLIVTFEPIVFPDLDRDESRSSPLAGGARKRRESFPSFEEAMDNYASKPPMQMFDPDVRRLYVAHGFRAAPEGVRLKCAPEHEARTYESSSTGGMFTKLCEVDTPVVVIGSGDGDGPAIIAPMVAEQLPHSTFIERSDLNHFGPFVDPASIAQMITDAID